MQAHRVHGRHIPVTFHRAFDLVDDPREALQVLRNQLALSAAQAARWLLMVPARRQRLCNLGVERILTSGQAKSALEGREVIAELERCAQELSKAETANRTRVQVGRWSPRPTPREPAH
eukprot:scaffold624_cov402-Prasinococcus_capsulatus_cf.AAC.8